MKTADRMTEIAELKRIWRKTTYEPRYAASMTSLGLMLAFGALMMVVVIAGLVQLAEWLS